MILNLEISEDILSYIDIKNIKLRSISLHLPSKHQKIAPSALTV
jgi:hypothetical protein